MCVSVVWELELWVAERGEAGLVCACVFGGCYSGYFLASMGLGLGKSWHILDSGTRVRRRMRGPWWEPSALVASPVASTQDNASKLLLALMESRHDGENAERILISLRPQELVRLG